MAAEVRISAPGLALNLSKRDFDVDFAHSTRFPTNAMLYAFLPDSPESAIWG